MEETDDLGPHATSLGFGEICDAHRVVYNKCSDYQLTDRAWAGLLALHLVVDKKVASHYICNRWIPEDVALAVAHERQILLGD